MGVPENGANMKKKQAPVAMISMLVAVVGVVVAFNVMTRPLSEEEQKTLAQKAQTDAVRPVGAPRASIPKEELVKAVAMPKIVEHKEGEGDDEASISPVPTILKATSSGFQPKPTDSDLNPQWYKKEHAAPKKPGGA